jgi:hypothetical protein
MQIPDIRLSEPNTSIYVVKTATSNNDGLRPQIGCHTCMAQRGLCAVEFSSPSCSWSTLEIFCNLPTSLAAKRILCKSGHGAQCKKKTTLNVIRATKFQQIHQERDRNFHKQSITDWFRFSSYFRSRTHRFCGVRVQRFF